MTEMTEPITPAERVKMIHHLAQIVGDVNRAGGPLELLFDVGSSSESWIDVFLYPSTVAGALRYSYTINGWDAPEQQRETYLRMVAKAKELLQKQNERKNDEK